MASQKELVRVVAQSLDAPIETVTVYDRFLAEAGLRTRALRGRGSTPMTYQDAANLIIATVLRVQPKDAVRVVQAYNALPAQGEAPAPTFGQSFVRLLEVFAQDRHALQARDDRQMRHAYGVMLRGPEPFAIIQIGPARGRRTIVEFGEDLNYKVRHTVEFSEWGFMPITDAVAADLPSTVPNRS